ncbi:MAG: hypothetical protein GY858_01080 [Candidatus Omnitrophica bacterium]|nr:hypothetical protein [Candidatus Omnitrophota bacterium]
MDSTIMNVNYFENIIIAPPKERIYARLKFAKGKTVLEDSQALEVEEHISQAASLINIKGAGVIAGVKDVEPNKVILSDGIVFESQQLVKFLEGCSQILIMGATAGQKIIDAISENNLTASVVFDATASEMIDESLNWIVNYFSRQLVRESKHITKRRYSAGYGDFTLDNQKIICDTLDLKRFGVSLTQSYILTPEKSVTAIAGIR